ncbi:MAG: site-specific integrase [Terricaulis sp.]
MDYLRQTSDGSYEVRIVVPEHLRQILKVKNLTKRLGTKNKAYAKQIASAHVSDLRKRLADAELGQASPPAVADCMQALGALDRWAAAERGRVLPVAFVTGADVPLSVAFDWKESWRSVEGGHEPAITMVDAGDAALMAALHSQGFSFAAGTNIPASLRTAFARCCGRLQHEIHITSGGSREYLDVVATPRAPSTLGSSQHVALTVSVAFERWRAKRERGGQDAGKTAREFETQIKRFIDIHGDIPVMSVTKTHCVDFRDLMSHYPARPTKEQRAVPIRDLVAALKASRVAYATLSPKTLNDTVFAAVKAVFADALDGQATPNPMAGIAVDEVFNREPPRLPYSDADIAALFASSSFIGSLVLTKAAAGLAQKWVPLLAAFTGARLEELAQLAVTDIKTTDAIPFIQFQEAYNGPDPGYKRSLKNASSHRSVPIHSALIELGFLTFVERQRVLGEVHLFPEMNWSEKKKRDKSEKVSERFTNWWASYSRGIVPDGKKTFHSFRHSVAERLRNAGVEDALSDALTGHATPGQGAKYGRNRAGGRYSLSILASAIERVQFHGLDITRIR